MRSVVVVGAAMVLVIAIAGCGTGTVSTAVPSNAAVPSSTPAPSSAPPSVFASPSAEPAIVGEWVATHECDRIVKMLTDAGLDEFLADAVYGNELASGDPNGVVADPTTVCEGAVDRQHSHFFTAAGKFGSRDFNGDTVDGGTYTLEGDDGLVINDSRFKYEITGDELSMEPEPVDISACTTRECRFQATWVLMVAMPGTTWKRGLLQPA
jgi:hypothetical protein